MDTVSFLGRLSRSTIYARRHQYQQRERHQKSPLPPGKGSARRVTRRLHLLTFHRENAPRSFYCDARTKKIKTHQSVKTRRDILTATDKMANILYGVNGE